MAVKPFGCSDCEKRFSRKDALKARQGMRRLDDFRDNRSYGGKQGRVIPQSRCYRRRR
ncbi:85e44882-dba1-4f4c-b3dd-f06524264d2e [Thermothielavioides terrestris]|uniref:85e44882-dba1-4f4c-b3dd-f06524264d2e n=1 Tax=Thermothielavioides terrestris TaxID=2587410 RepID=A0A3S4EYQ9_9PEZI|nr:85e44882-dba1-4f4c-b3dd-f06524264d2e [Thermothielavioides terrestris]